MYKYILETAGNINWMALFALLTFLTIFLISIWMVLRDNKSYIDKMSNLPLDEDKMTDR
ncbi:MAG: hypothetical protein IPM42_02465 [Saprospiraceae bacterium]|nr:hypothetical protein [Saprospiraceae bacterium]